jgi:hypothetical protein
LYTFAVQKAMKNLLVFEPELEAESPRAVAQADTSQGSIGWTFLMLIGAAFALVGGTDLAVAWIPQAFGNPEWEFGTVSSTLDGMPVFALGLALVLTAAVAGRERRLARTIAVVFLLLAVAIVGMAVLYVTVVPLALRSIADPTIKQGLMKAIVKSLTQAVVYPTVFTWLGIKAWRLTAAR